MTTKTVYGMFAGIGGMELGLHATGHYETVLHSEIDPHCNKVLAHHWPDTPNIGDCTTAEYEVNPNGTIYAENTTTGEGHWLPPIDIITGGFPCQDATVAWNGKGIHGKRTGLYTHIIRAAQTIRPTQIILENVPGLIRKGLSTVVTDLASIGYVCTWNIIPATISGALHERKRLFIIATLANPHDPGCEKQRRRSTDETQHTTSERYGEIFSRAWAAPITPTMETSTGSGTSIRHWPTEPRVGRVADGFPGRVDRLRALGNAIVPAVAAYIGEVAHDIHNQLHPPTPS